MVICCIICIYQRDMKSMVAYSSIVHMRFLLIILVLIAMGGKRASLMMMLSHGYISVALFFLVGEVTHYLQTRLVYYFNRLLVSNYLICIIFSVFFLMNCGLPLSLSFFSELFGIVCILIIVKLSLCLLFFYFLISFYYSLYPIIFFILGKGYVYIGGFVLFSLIPLVVVVFNLLIFILI